MKFIGGGVEKNNQDGDGGFAPLPRARVVWHRFAHGAPEQGGKDGVFGQVRAFAEEMMNGLDMRLGHMREEPVQ